MLRSRFDLAKRSHTKLKIILDGIILRRIILLLERNAHVEDKLVAVAALEHPLSMQLLHNNTGDIALLSRLRFDVAGTVHAPILTHASAE